MPHEASNGPGNLKSLNGPISGAYRLSESATEIILIIWTPDILSGGNSIKIVLSPFWKGPSIKKEFADCLIILCKYTTLLLIGANGETFLLIIELNLSLAEHNKPCLSKLGGSRSVGFFRSALFVIKYVNFYQKPRSSNLIGWKLEAGLAS